MKLATYTVGQGDTIEVLAQQLFGDPTQSDALVQINQLRYPYISDNPIDQYARPKGNVFLQRAYVNPSSVTISNPNGVVISPNDTVFFMEGSTYSASAVLSVNGNAITFATPLAGMFDQAATVTVFVNQQNISTQVLKTGDTLLYPSDGTTVQSGSVQQNYSMVFGTDFALDENGFLMRSNGDIATVSGTDNLAQALNMRLQTPLGGLPLHPTYGNELFNVLGEAGETYFIGLAKYYIEECAKQEIRVQDASVTSAQLIEGALLVTLSYTTAANQGAINQQISIPIGGVS